MFDKIKELLGGATAIVLGIAFVFGYAFSWILGIFTAVVSEQSPGWMLFDIILSLFIPFYGTITWVIYVLS